MSSPHNPLSASDVPFALEHQLIKDLIANRLTIEQCEKRKKELTELKHNLEFYGKRLKHQIYAPMGKKIMMKAEMIHTNEVTVFIGDTYFVKVTSADAIEICQRRLEGCEEVLSKCLKERQLLESRRDPQMRSEAFGGREIIEKFDETEEEKWRKEHREKVRQHKKRLAEVKEKLETMSAKTEEEVFARLDQLEMEEELQDELDRMVEDDEDIDEDDDDDEEEEKEVPQDEQIVPKTTEKKKVKWLNAEPGAKSNLEPISEFIEPPSPPSEQVKELVQTTAIKNEITETKPFSAANVAKPSRPASKFKKSRQGAD